MQATTLDYKRRKQRVVTFRRHSAARKRSPIQRHLNHLSSFIAASHLRLPEEHFKANLFIYFSCLRQSSQHQRSHVPATKNPEWKGKRSERWKESKRCWIHQQVITPMLFINLFYVNKQPSPRRQAVCAVFVTHSTFTVALRQLVG